MKLTKCENQHFYDADTYSACPHCSNVGSEDKTVALKRSDKRTDEDDVVTVGVSSTPDQTISSKAVSKNTHIPQTDDDVTIGVYKKTTGVEPVVGWVIVLNGKHTGRDFRLKSGRNFIGRSDSLGVALTGENSVSRDIHAMIVFEPKTNTFFAQPGDSKELFYVNGDVVLTQVKLKRNDRIEVGDVELMLIPCCDENFTWPVADKTGNK